MTHAAKQKTLVLLLLCMILIAIIAAGLPRLEFLPGQPFPGLDELRADPGPITPRTEMPFAFKSLWSLLVLVGVLLAYTIYKIVTGVPWREILAPMLFFLLFFAGALILLIGVLQGVDAPAALEPEIVPLTPERVTTPLGAAPMSIVWLVWIVLTLLTVLLGVWLVFFRGRPGPAPNPVLWEAEKALEALKTGGDLRNVILNCYRQMSLTLQKEQGIEREEAMTAREFEAHLTAQGLPPEPVHQLTQLFEAVRYGSGQPGPEDEQRAVHCLEAIVGHMNVGHTPGSLR